MPPFHHDPATPEEARHEQMRMTTLCFAIVFFCAAGASHYYMPEVGATDLRAVLRTGLGVTRLVAGLFGGILLLSYVFQYRRPKASD